MTKSSDTWVDCSLIVKRRRPLMSVLQRFNRRSNLHIMKAEYYTHPSCHARLTVVNKMQNISHAKHHPTHPFCRLYGTDLFVRLQLFSLDKCYVTEQVTEQTDAVGSPSYSESQLQHPDISSQTMKLCMPFCFIF